MKNSPDYDSSFIEYLDLSRGHFWFHHRNRVMHRALKNIFRDRPVRILELGAGSANILAYLVSRGVAVDGSDVFDESIDCIERYTPNAFKYDINIDPHRYGGMEKFKGMYDAVILGDVIEHLEDPAGGLKNAKYFCKKGGKVIVTVPALGRLWTEYDIRSGHKRRYDTHMLREDFDRAGLKCLSAQYFFFTAALALFLGRGKMDTFKGSNEEFIRAKFRISGASNTLCKMICGLEFIVANFVKLPFGSSVIGIGETV